MTSLAEIHHESRYATYLSLKGEEASKAKEILIKAQEAEVSIYKAIYKEEIRKMLPASARISIAVGSIFSNQIELPEPKRTLVAATGVFSDRFVAQANGDRVYRMQIDQFERVRKLDGIMRKCQYSSSVLSARAEVDRLTFSLSDSILKNWEPVVRLKYMDDEKLNKICNKTVKDRESLLACGGEVIYKSVLRESKKQAAEALDHEDMIGNIAVTGSLAGVYLVKGYLDGSIRR
ncbi:MAG: hypothetical protein V4489_08540 [Chlamydiota bacterium]